MRDRRSRLLVAGLLTLGLFATPFTTHDGTASAAQPLVQPAATPTSDPIIGPAFPALPSLGEPKAKVTLNPAAHTVAVSFGKGYARRLATLQQQVVAPTGDATPVEWVVSGASKKLDSKGRATFGADIADDSRYRVSLSSTELRRARHSPSATLADQWGSAFSDHFDEDQLDATTWSDRMVGNQVPSRLCSLPSDRAGVRFVDNSDLAAGISRHTDDQFFTDVVARANPLAEARLKKELAAAKHLSTKRKRHDAIAKANYRFKTTYNCPQGAFENAMVSTMANDAGLRVNTAKPGIVAARVKFPSAQGMHTGVWLQSFAKGGGEIDIAETFGYGDGLVNILHVPSTGKMYRPGNPNALKQKGGWVIRSKTGVKDWWDEYHEVSVEWTSTAFVFRVDGSVTKTIRMKPGKAEYYLILSLLSSDWELPRLARPIRNGEPVTDVSGQKFLVDWVRIWSRAS